MDRTLADGRVVVLKEPAGTLLVVSEFGRVVTFVEVLKHGGEDFRLFVREVESFAGTFEELCAAVLSEVGGFAEDVFVGGEESLGGTNAYRYDG